MLETKKMMICGDGDERLSSMLEPKWNTVSTLLYCKEVDGKC